MGKLQDGTFANCSELFEVAYRWILAPPIRDVRALCATQSVPGSTKQRAKKKKSQAEFATVMPAGEPAPIELGSECKPPPTDIGTEPPGAMTSNPVPEPLPAHPSSWIARNPALAQYHQYVWQIQQSNPKADNSEDTFATIMQKLQSPPEQPPAARPSPPNYVGTQIALPPTKFNMGQPPATLVSSGQQMSSVSPQPSWQSLMHPPSPAPPPYRPVSATMPIIDSQRRQTPVIQSWTATGAVHKPFAPFSENQSPPLSNQQSLRPLYPRPPAPMSSTQQFPLPTPPPAPNSLAGSANVTEGS